MAFSRIDEFMHIVTRQLGIDDTTLAIVKIWDIELGPLAAHAKLMGVKEGHLLVEVTSSTYLQEITLRRTAILKKINQHFGPTAKVAKSIRVFLK